MYLPKHFEVKHHGEAINLIKQNPFTTLLSFPFDSDVFINHLPIIIEKERTEGLFLIGHMSKKNPQWSHFKTNTKCIVIAQGPHCYISPTWYRSGRDVPTWNYAVAHFEGSVSLLHTFEEQVSILKKMSSEFEQHQNTPWSFELPSDLNQPQDLNNAIVGFRIKVETIKAKFKLSQNRSEEDRKGIKDALKKQNDHFSQAIHNLMDGR